MAADITDLLFFKFEMPDRDADLLDSIHSDSRSENKAFISRALHTCPRTGIKRQPGDEHILLSG